ncbi:hypothetical protein EAY64_13545 [Aquitalea palustris]|uniref:Uncharacterized protein n=1 Tax=Aquitalea palustris TaxID=2480983 RepID=A0A454JGM4_9NEIS|nr:hypothetical protein [Aquitalea palustris]RMC95597.1 hypothetical protein EAY64_13545 [Aquitalea palustris]
MHLVPENVRTIIDLISRSATIKLVKAYGDSNCLELGHNSTINKVLVLKYRLCDCRIEEILDKEDDLVPLRDTGQVSLF